MKETAHRIQRRKEIDALRLELSNLQKKHDRLKLAVDKFLTDELREPSRSQLIHNLAAAL